VRGVVRSALALAAAWIAAMVGCSGNAVVIATLPAAEDAATPLRCTGNSDDGGSDCPPGTYCEKPTCDSPAGTCQLVPAVCDDVEQPYCGCDGVTYFNDCLRKLNGIASSVALPCQLDSAQVCGAATGETCPLGASCAQFTRAGPPPCPMSAVGTCWVLPLQCPPASPGDVRWRECGGGEPCVDTCTAIQSGGVYQHAMMCP
jgi:hypothetical protein